ncbi:MAG: gliding motility-related protein [Actinomycetota bacterium]
MAGGKETPRQKMIGMMYLVLTALLALQVSSAIIQKFQFLDDSLQQAVEVSNKANGETQAKIAKQVKENPKDQYVLDKAEQVRAETSKLISYIKGLREELVTKTGGKEEDGSYNDRPRRSRDKDSSESLADTYKDVIEAAVEAPLGEDIALDDATTEEA